MLVEDALRQLLVTNDAVTAIVSSRVFPSILERNVVYPAVVYRQESGDHEFGLLGSSGLKRARFRIFSTARKEEGNPNSGYLTTILLAEAVRQALQGFRGEVFHPTAPESLFIQNIVALSEHDIYEDKTQSYQRLADYDVWVQEPIPIFI